MVLFFVDFAIFRKTGIFVHRLHDDIWFWGEPSKVAEAWQVLGEIAKLFGLDFNWSKTGSVYFALNNAKSAKITSILPPGPVSVGFLDLDPSSGEWEINEQKSDAHLKQLRKQLNESSSVLSWVHTWNSCIGRFFGNTFGEPAYIFGPKHVKRILETYTRMQRELFESDGKAENLANHIKTMLHERFDATYVPEAFLYFPESLGGLGIINPFIRLLLVNDDLTKSPDELFEEMEVDEDELWSGLKEAFEKLPDREKRTRATRIYGPGSKAEMPDMDSFMRREEYLPYRETMSSHLSNLYQKLISVPVEKPVGLTEGLSYGLDLVDPSNEMMWLLELHHQTLIDELGGTRLIPKKFLPLAVLKMVREKAVAWRMVI